MSLRTPAGINLSCGKIYLKKRQQVQSTGPANARRDRPRIDFPKTTMGFSVRCSNMLLQKVGSTGFMPGYQSLETGFLPPKLEMPFSSVQRYP
jgi:hypothetical protein